MSRSETLSEKDVLKLRTTLADQLDSSCNFMSHASSVCKRTDCLSMLLHARRDIAHQRLCEAVQTVSFLKIRIRIVNT